MCQGCVDIGLLTQETLNFTEAFSALFPEAEFGPAHIVIGDDNVDDYNVDYCLERTKAALGRPGVDDDYASEMKRMYKDHDRAELEATLLFLEILKLIPEDDR